jgi:hypothetical protein
MMHGPKSVHLCESMPVDQNYSILNLFFKCLQWNEHNPNLIWVLIPTSTHPIYIVSMFQLYLQYFFLDPKSF